MEVKREFGSSPDEEKAWRARQNVFFLCLLYTIPLNAAQRAMAAACRCLDNGDHFSAFKPISRPQLRVIPGLHDLLHPSLCLLCNLLFANPLPQQAVAGFFLDNHYPVPNY